ncbi:WhiB family redox-sensing transcriptional regulator [Nonomuraea thailandensis]|uniref:Transcriptional regulator WhiB n=1 Tax=Nonomuraea thailandensis TaxID=1188745 RepID=A0A9X2K258_9ACTN|nr:WhiB family transcriptional regulator [Nonomuraea thailandensis]MCP2358027.1 WhiB family redox-sensing transcriptional regulator [Nonomuraea thailandensis]
MIEISLRWADRAACGTHDPDLFFPLAWETLSTAQAADVRSICAACAVRRPCLEWALATGEADGMWGGVTPRERRRMRAARNLRTPPEAPAPHALARQRTPERPASA